MNPGVSDASTGVLRQRCMSAYAPVATTGSPPSHGTISTSGINIAGLKKWMPVIRAGVSHTDAIEATDNDDVLVASTASLGTARSSRRNTDCFVVRSSTIASITKPHEPYVP